MAKTATSKIKKNKKPSPTKAISAKSAPAEVVSAKIAPEKAVSAKTVPVKVVSAKPAPVKAKANEVVKPSKKRALRAKKVVYRYFSPDSKQVEIAGEFNDWIPEDMKALEDGYWQAELKLKPGSYAYRLVFEGDSWEADPNSPQTTGPYGPNSILQI
jgi:hypothetical protein